MQSFQVNLDSIKQQSAQQNGNGSKTKWMRFGSGRTVIRILPPWSSAGMIAKEVHTHSIEFHSENANRWKFTCPKRTSAGQKTCPICDHLQMLKQQGMPTDKFVGMGKEYWVNALVVEDPNYDGMNRGYAPNTHVLLALPKTVLNVVYENLMNPLVGNVTDLVLGVDFEVIKTGQGLNTRYNTKVVRRSDITEIVKDIELYDLDELFGTAGSDDLITELKLYMTSECGAAAQAMGKAIPMNTYNNYQQTDAPAPAYPAGYQAPTAPTAPTAPMGGSVVPTTMSPFAGGTGIANTQQPSDDPKPEGCPGTYNPATVTCLVCAQAGRCMNK